MQLKDLLGASYKEGMTLEEVSQALQDIQMPTDQSAEIDRLKGVISQANSEAADWKRKFQATQSEEQQKKDADEEERQNLLNQIAELKKTQTIANYKASYLSMGYDEALADEAAKAIAEGDTAKVLEVQKKHQESLVEKTKKELLKNSGRPVGGNASDEDGEVESEGVRLARQIGKQRADSAKAAEDVMSHYLRH